MAEQFTRLRIMQVDEIMMLQLMGQWEPSGQVIRYYCPEIPEDAKLLRCWHSDMTRSWSYMFTHPDFEEVPLGAMPPSVQARIRSVKVVANEE